MCSLTSNEGALSMSEFDAPTEAGAVYSLGEDRFSGFAPIPRRPKHCRHR